MSGFRNKKNSIVVLINIQLIISKFIFFAIRAIYSLSVAQTIKAITEITSVVPEKKR